MDEGNKEAGQTTGQGQATVPAATTTAPAVSEIAKRLEEGGAAQVARPPEAAKPVEPMELDVSKLRPEQIQMLKEMFANTPDKAPRRQFKPVVNLRRYQGQFIIDFKDAFNSLIRKEETGMTEEVMQIPVRFLGTDSFTNIIFKEFMQADQVRCEVVSSRRDNYTIPDGNEPVRNKETGQLVDRVITAVRDFYTVKLPEGTTPETVEVEGRIANS